MKKNGRYYNPHSPVDKRSFKDVVLWQLGYFKDKHEENVPDSFTFPRQIKECERDQPYAAWINHSSFLVHCDGVSILTDPIWSRRCSPVSFCGPKRQHQPGLSIDELPSIDIVLISHNHYDHLDKYSVKELFARFPAIHWFVPIGVKQWFHALGITQVTELNWWEEFSLTSEIKVAAVPAQHFSGRHLKDMNRSLWAGWVVEFKREQQLYKRLYFVGDTGYNHVDFKAIGAKFAPIDLSLVPIGSYRPKAFMQPVHVNPEEAVMIHREVGSRLSIGMHWKTFRLSDEKIEQPPYDLYCALKNKGIDPSTFMAVHPGETINW